MEERINFQRIEKTPPCYNQPNPVSLYGWIKNPNSPKPAPKSINPAD
jgi:hypothetical protein